jgi:6-phosphogluconolactonase
MSGSEVRSAGSEARSKHDFAAARQSRFSAGERALKETMQGKRMKRSKLVPHRLGRAAMAAGISLALGLGITACSRDYTVAYVYTASTQNQTITAFGVDYQSGTLAQLDGSPFAVNGKNPVALVTSPNSKFLYSISNFSAEVDPYGIGSDGKLYALHSANTTGSYPVAAAIDPAGTFLYVVNTLQPQYTTASAGPGSISIFPINTDGTLGTPTTQNVGNNPVGIAISAQTGFAYVIDQEATAGQLLVFARNTTTGALTPSGGTTITTVNNTTVAKGAIVGSQPSAIVEDPTSRFVYVTDRINNQVYAFSASGVNGAVTPLVTSPYNTAQLPVALTVDPRGKYLYVANYSSGSITTFSIGQADGSLTGTAAGSQQTGLGASCISIEPALGKYMYVTDKLTNQLSGLTLQSETGALANIEDTPFDVGPLPVGCATAANGEHATQIVYP